MSLAVVLTASLLFVQNWNAQRPFDREIWLHYDDDSEQGTSPISNSWKDYNVRLKMIDDLKPKLLGISKTEVENLLGKPDPDMNPADYSTDYYYLLGTRERILDTDGLWLHLKFENDHVKDAQVISD